LQPGDHSVVATVKNTAGVTSSVTVVKFQVTVGKKIAAFVPVTISAAVVKGGKVLITVKKAKGKTIKIAVSGSKSISKKATSDNFQIRIATKKGSHRVTVTVGTAKLVKTLKVK
jgi:hypothetical protein